MFGQCETIDLFIILAVVILLFSACHISKITREFSNVISNFKKGEEGDNEETKT